MEDIDDQEDPVMRMLREKGYDRDSEDQKVPVSVELQRPLDARGKPVRFLSEQPAL